MTNPVAALLMAPIRLYQKYVSPGLPRRCRYYPTCSAYAVEALRVHGAVKGVLLGTWRVLRCNPWSAGGVDHVPERGKWQAPPWIPPDDWAGHDIPEGGGGEVSARSAESEPARRVMKDVPSPAPDLGGGGDDPNLPLHKES